MGEASQGIGKATEMLFVEQYKKPIKICDFHCIFFAVLHINPAAKPRSDENLWVDGGKKEEFL